MTENEISKIIVDCALKVHRALGPGLLESSYEECLFYEIGKRNLKVEKQKALLINFNVALIKHGIKRVVNNL